MAAVYVVTAAAEQGGLHGLITVRIIFKPRPCAELAGKINADLVPISHVIGSHQLGRVVLEVITVTVVGRTTSTGRCSVLFLDGTNWSM